MSEINVAYSLYLQRIAYAQMIIDEAIKGIEI